MSDLASAVLAALSPSITVVVGWVLHRRVKAAGDDAKAAREQVVNAHATNLRDDIDCLADALSRMRSEASVAFGTVRRDLGTVRSEQRGLHRDVASLREDVSGVRDDQRRLRGDLDDHLRNL